MNPTTFKRRSTLLIKQIADHPHKQELLDLMYDQLADELAVNYERTVTDCGADCS
jgi:hypothetical protein